MPLYKKGFEACTPVTMSRNVFRDIDKEKETNGF